MNDDNWKAECDLPSMTADMLVVAPGDHSVYREHAEQARGSVLVLDIFYGGGSGHSPRLPQGALAEDYFEARRPSLPR